MELSTTHILRRRIYNPSHIFILACLLSQALLVPTAVAALQPAQQNTNVWVRVDGQAYPDAIFSDVEFINATHGWVIGQSDYQGIGNGIVLSTEDGGDTWSVQLVDSNRLFRQICIVDQRIIWVSSLGILFYSSDFGNTWNESRVVVGNAGLGMVSFANSTHGWTSNDDILYITANGGSSWSTVPGWTFNDTLRRMQFASQTEVQAIGFFGVYHSNDGAESWEQTSSLGGWAVSFVDESNGWAIGDNRLARTTDGVSWSELSIPGPSPLSSFLRPRPPYCTDILFLDADHGWIVGQETPVMHTPNGGVDWYSQDTGSVHTRIIAVDFVNHTHGWAAGWDGVILKTTSGNLAGSRLWNGLADSLLLTITGVAAVAVVACTAIIIWWRRQRRGGNASIAKNESGPTVS